ncbi:neurogenic locus notch-like protein 1 [Plakobranchus ocellatus]|uniref:Neurogenic locus notch-like protein 1 n=1 Tax=Plakobranchus ocellatus TaxID=259542 RepID=A0AAV3XWQ0_9GAST|nr:neurogenic locus notch-like protein 1 [Plakobranchus ocellatus]
MNLFGGNGLLDALFCGMGIIVLLLRNHSPYLKVGAGSWSRPYFMIRVIRVRNLSTAVLEAPSSPPIDHRFGAWQLTLQGVQWSFTDNI